MRALMLLSLRQMLSGKKIWILAIFLCLPLLLLAVVLLASGFDFPQDDQVDIEGLAMSAFLYVMYPQSLCLIASLLYGASLLAGEIEDKTLTYLFTRRMPRWQILLGKYLATATALALMTCLSMSGAYLLSGLPFAPGVWIALVVSICGACFGYTALFCLLGLFVPRRAIPVGLIYAAVVEGLLSLVPAVVNELTLSYYLRSIAWQIADIPLPAELSRNFEDNLAPFVAGADVSSGLIAIVVIAAGSLLVSGLVIHRKQWPLTEGV